MRIIKDRTLALVESDRKSGRRSGSRAPFLTLIAVVLALLVASPVHAADNINIAISGEANNCLPPTDVTGCLITVAVEGHGSDVSGTFSVYQYGYAVDEIVYDAHSGGWCIGGQKISGGYKSYIGQTMALFVRDSSVARTALDQVSIASTNLTIPGSYCAYVLGGAGPSWTTATAGDFTLSVSAEPIAINGETNNCLPPTDVPGCLITVAVEGQGSDVSGTFSVEGYGYAVDEIVYEPDSGGWCIGGQKISGGYKMEIGQTMALFVRDSSVARTAFDQVGITSTNLTIPGSFCAWAVAPPVSAPFWITQTAGDFAFSQVSDTSPPEVTCPAPDSAWHTINVSLTCTASDSGSGLADPADASFTLSTAVPTGSEDANASTNSRQVCDNAGNCVTAGPVGPFKIDLSAPTITLAQTTVGAISPSGAPASAFGATASDGVYDPNPPVACSPDPVAIGDTVLTCSATDQAGNATTQPFTVHVEGPDEQTSDLLTTVTDNHLGSGNSLSTKLQAVLDSLARGNTSTACLQLGAFIREVSAQSGKKLTTEEADSLIAAATQIQAVLGC